MACVAFGTPLSAFLGVLISQYLGRKSATELDHRGRREETMRTMRWASELAVNTEDEPKADLGVAQLEALLESNLLDETEQVFVEATLGVVYEDLVTVLDSLGAEDVAGVDVIFDVDGNVEPASSATDEYDGDSSPGKS